MQRVTAMLAVLFLSASVARTEGAPATVHLSLVPGASFDLPKGWIACDDATNKLLGQADDPHGIGKNVCVTIPGVPYKFRAFNPLLFNTVSMMIDQHDAQDISPADLAAITPEIATRITPQVCDDIVKPLTGDGTTIQECHMMVGVFAGHKALHSTVVAIPPDKDSKSRYQIDIYEMPYADGYLEVQFNTPILYQPTTQPQINGIIASFIVE